MAEKKVTGYESEGYKQSKNLYDSIVQAFINFKAEKGANLNFIAVENLKGVTMKLVSNNMLTLTYHRIENGTTDSLARDVALGANFLKEVESGLKKSFKKLTKKALNLKKVKEDQVTEKYGFMQADTSWVGSGRYSGGPSGRYLVRDMRVYSFSEDTLE